MFEKFNTIEIDGKSFPIKCDINVLAAVQEEFGNMNNFEMKLLGLTPVMEEGKIKLMDNGKPAFVKGEPSVKAVKFALPLMLKEGKDAAKEQGEEGEEISIKAAVKNVEFDIYSAAVIMHEEFSRCFHRKNE